MAVLPPGFERARPILTDELGVTYAAVRSGPGQDREVALRLLTVSVAGRPSRRQFRGSCLAATVIAGQPGVLALHDVLFNTDNQPCLVTDVPAGTLSARLTSGPLPVAEALGVAAGLAGTIKAAHEAGIVHLDVRPANVVATSGRTGPLLAHFGVSRAVSAAGDAELPVACLAHAGREMFGWDIPGPAADVHGLASTLHAMLAGQAPYAAEARIGRAALYQRVLRGGPPPVPRPGIPGSVTTLMAAMMDPDPASRPALSEVIEALELAAPDERAALSDLTAPDDLAESAALADVAASPPFGRRAESHAPPLSPAAAGPAGRTRTLAPPEAEDRRLGAAGERLRARERRPTGLLLLVAAGVLALLAGLVWGLVTGPRPEPPRGDPTVRATTSASPIPSARLAAARPTAVQVFAKPGAMVVNWSAPANVRGVTAYLVVAESAGAATQERTVGLGTHRAVFGGLTDGLRYCFVVGALIEEAGSQARTAAAQPVCATAGRQRN